MLHPSPLRLYGQASAKPGLEWEWVEGRLRAAPTYVAGAAADPEIINAYNQKYDWDYDTARYGPLRCVEPATILAWRTAGWAGRDGFQQTGR